MRCEFVKMHGAANDYIYIDGFGGKALPDNLPAVSERLSRRRFFVGADGLIVLLPCAEADARMLMFNADGSESPMCGNGIRCAAAYLYNRGIVKNQSMRILTGSGVKEITLELSNGVVTGALVDMGAPVFAPDQIPVLTPKTPPFDIPIAVLGNIYHVNCVSMGNPHAVCFIKNPGALDLASIGPYFEHHPLFPERVNAEFVEIDGPASMVFRVWERGSGETMACGTGISAAAAVAFRKGFFKPGQEITVTAKGGVLSVSQAENGHIMLKGPAVTVYEGLVEL